MFTGEGVLFEVTQTCSGAPARRDKKSLSQMGTLEGRRALIHYFSRINRSGTGISLTSRAAPELSKLQVYVAFFIICIDTRSYY